MVIAGLDRRKGGKPLHHAFSSYHQPWLHHFFIFCLSSRPLLRRGGQKGGVYQPMGRHTIQAKTARRRSWWSLVLLLPVRRGSGAREPRKRSGGATKPIALPKHGGKRAKPCLYGVPPRVYYFLLYSLHSLGAKVAGAPGTRSVA